jgi:hypothetical protein
LEDELDGKRRAGGDLFQELHHLGEAEGLAETGGGAALERLIDDVVFGEARNHDESGLRLEGAELLERLQSAHAGHTDVEEDQIEEMVAGHLQAAGAVLASLHAVAEAGEDVAEQHADALLVVNDKDVKWRWCHSMPPAIEACVGFQEASRRLLKGLIP